MLVWLALVLSSHACWLPICTNFACKASIVSCSCHLHVCRTVQADCRQAALDDSAGCPHFFAHFLTLHCHLVRRRDLEERRIYVYVFKHLRRQQAKLDKDPAKQVR